MISEKKKRQSNFEGKDLFLRIYLRKKNPTLKKISFMAYNVEKNLTHLFAPEKNSILLPARGLAEKKFLPKPNHPYSPASRPSSKVKWSVPNNPNETSHIPKQLLHYTASKISLRACYSYFSHFLDVKDLPLNRHLS